jgi:hypothetical protein
MRTDRNWIGFIFKTILCLLFMLWPFVRAKACQCPLTQLGLEECNKYEIIFKGKIISVVECGSKPGEAIFEIEELYKGNATKEFKVLFECKGECAQKFLVGEEWIIYSRYKQINNAMMDWCSRSRKYFRNDKEDFYATTYGNDYYDEVKFLRENLGLHRLLAEDKTQSENRNKKPDISETVLILVCSLLAIILFYFLFNKFFR